MRSSYAASCAAKPNILAVRLDAHTIDRLAEVGRAKGLGPSTLARMWLLERLEQEKWEPQAGFTLRLAQRLKEYL